jgi:hypothetical protein
VGAQSDASPFGHFFFGIVTRCLHHFFEFFGGSSPAAAGKLLNEPFGEDAITRFYFFGLFGGNSRANDNETSARLAVVVMNESAFAALRRDREAAV